MLLDLSAVDFEEILLNCKTEIAVPCTDDEFGSAEGVGEGVAGIDSAVNRCQEEVVTKQSKETKETKQTKAKSNKLYLAAVLKEEVQMAIDERDYARRGLAYLSEDELNKRNFAYGPVKRDVSALL